MSKKSVYRSGFERKAAAYLESLGVPVLYETQRIKYKVPETSNTYTPDFTLPNGIICEMKGNFDRASRKKMELVIAQHPELDIRLVFMRNNKLSKVSKTSYTTWCAKRGIKCCVSPLGQIPKEWLR